jgi:AcrR family transcriptional regulator
MFLTREGLTGRAPAAKPAWKSGGFWLKNVRTTKAERLAQRKAPVQARARRSIQHLLDATQRVLISEGPSGISTPTIAREAGVSVGALYNYFPNKESLVLALYETKLAEIRAVVEAPVVRTGDWRADVATWLRSIKAREAEIEYGVALNEAMGHFPGLHEVSRRHLSTQAGIVAQQIKALGSTWPDEALFDLALHAVFLNSAAWLYWAFAGEELPQAIDRLVATMIALVAPALEGAAPPEGRMAKPSL